MLLVCGDTNRRDAKTGSAGAAVTLSAGRGSDRIASRGTRSCNSSSVAWMLVDQMNPAGDTLALASIEFDLTKVASGQQVTVKWRGKPLFVRNRTEKEIAEAVKDDHASMRDPQTDAERHKPGKAQWLILIGTCTHLGCVPTFGGGGKPQRIMVRLRTPSLSFLITGAMASG